ncbi:MAG TPA: DNA methyltransferase [Candidatus Nitrosotalea sp.]|nr:DNA methyltransferase [Candidatus Nitrosotalea sp.]
MTRVRPIESLSDGSEDFRRIPGHSDPCAAVASEQSGSKQTSGCGFAGRSRKDQLTPDASSPRRRARINSERVTRRFFDLFQEERAALVESIRGIPEKTDREWYASVILNRVMFIQFIQRKGFLDGNPEYLRNLLNRCRWKKVIDRPRSSHRRFLLRLFHEGLGKRRGERSLEFETLFGRVPFLNGGYFERHRIEQQYSRIEIPDIAFERLLNVFDRYEWRLDEPPRRSENEINAPVLGFVLERHVNQKQMGAYYTKADITEYISKNTIIPFLFDAVRKLCSPAFEVSLNAGASPADVGVLADGSRLPEWNAKRRSIALDGGCAPYPTVWDLLAANPDHYIHPSVRHGTGLPLPADITAGMNDPSKRANWDKRAPGEYALPTETWREVVARRNRCEEIRKRLEAGDVRDINELITLNLDIRQFAQDVIENCGGPELLRAFWQTIERVTILDPTCGSGAFLFAALDVLEALYSACLDRMESIIRNCPDPAGANGQDEFADFRVVLERADAQSNRRQFILRSIMCNNLFGVDIMEEAVEICKLRLFLKLMEHTEPDVAKDNSGIEPLPDLDFNIRGGNALVGYAFANDVRLESADTAVRNVRRQQMEQSGAATANDKARLKSYLKKLENKLDGRLAAEYGLNPGDKVALAKWKKSHQPFHWFAGFPDVVSRGGFDVIIGNPPYVSAARARKEYGVLNLTTNKCPDIYAWVLERSESLLRDSGRSGMIVPLSLGFSGDFAPIRRLLFSRYGRNWFSSFGRIPSALFSFDVRVRNSIHLAHKGGQQETAFTSRLHRWFEAARPHLFETLEYAPFTPGIWNGRIPKLNTPALGAAFENGLRMATGTLAGATSPRATRHILHFKKTAYNWLNFCRRLPPCYEGTARVEHTQFGAVCFRTAEERDLALLLCSGRLAFVYWIAIGDDFHVPNWTFEDFPIDIASISPVRRQALIALVPRLEETMRRATQFKLNAGRRVGNYNLVRCRHITDQADRIFCDILGLTAVWDDIELYCSQIVKTDFDKNRSPFGRPVL